MSGKSIRIFDIKSNIPIVFLMAMFLNFFFAIETCFSGLHMESGVKNVLIKKAEN